MWFSKFLLWNRNNYQKLDVMFKNQQNSPETIKIVVSCHLGAYLNNQNRLEKNAIIIENGCHFAGSWVIRQIPCTAHQDHPRYVFAKYHWDHCKMRSLEPGQIFEHTFWIRRQHQTCQKIIHPTLHVWPNKYTAQILCWLKLCCFTDL